MFLICKIRRKTSAPEPFFNKVFKSILKIFKSTYFYITPLVDASGSLQFPEIASILVETKF